MPSRRQFLHLSCLAAPALLLPLPLRSGRPPQTRGPTLGLFFDEAALPVLRARFANDPLFAALRERLEAIDREGERRFLAAEVRYNDHLYDIKRVSDTAQQMAFLYAMTGDEEAAALAADALRTLMRFPKWDYFLEAGDRVFGLQRAPGATMAVALGADWLGDFVGEDERAAWLRTMGARGCEASYLALYGMRYPDRVVGWTMDPTSTYLEHRPGDLIDLSNWPHILNRTNLKAVPAAALAVGAAAYQQHFGESDDTRRWLEQAIYSLQTFGDLYARDGSYDEGVSYANYTSLHLAQATSVLERFGLADLYDLINWPGYVDYLYEMTLPTDDDPYAIVNFGDAGTGATAAVPFWVAARSHDGRGQWFGREMARDHDEWSLLWYDPALLEDAPPATPHTWQSDLDWIVARTGYAPADLVVAMRSGGPSNHEHADRNSVIVKCYGEKLVADPYRPPYSFSDPAWMMRTTAGHSALLIDGHGHQYHDGSEGTNPSYAVARIIRKVERDGYLAWTSDATPAYRLVLPDVRSVTRTVVVLHELPAILILDKVLKEREPSTLQARFFAFNLDGQGRLEATETGFQTFRPHATLLGQGFSQAGIEARLEILPIPDKTARQHPFAEIRTQEARLAPLLLTVLLPQEKSGRASVQAEISSGGVYMLALQNRGRTVHCRVSDAGPIPEFSLG